MRDFDNYCTFSCTNQIQMPEVHQRWSVPGNTKINVFIYTQTRLCFCVLGVLLETGQHSEEPQDHPSYEGILLSGKGANMQCVLTVNHTNMHIRTPLHICIYKYTVTCNDTCTHARRQQPGMM